MRLLLIALALCATLSLQAQTKEYDYGQAHTIKIWDNTTAPHSSEQRQPEHESDPHRIWHNSEAKLYIFPADKAKATGQAVVICPGGAYSLLSMDQEGYLMAQWLASNGITAAVLKYRMPNGHPEVPLEDAEQALRIMSGLEAGATGFTADKVGIMGFSAGGHLAAMASTLGRHKPAFTILFYAVLSSEPELWHDGTFMALAGSRTAEGYAEFSLEKRVTSTTPPALIFATDDDTLVPATNSTRYYEALKRAGIPAALHIYPSGGHGWGTYDWFPYKKQWQESLLDWMSRINQK